MSWSDLALNPYGIKVQENEQGIRRYQVFGGWKLETTETIEVCRANNSHEIIIASKAMSDLLISKSYDHNPFKTALVWLTPKGTATNLSDKMIEKAKANKKAIMFQKFIENELGRRVLFMWMANAEWNENLPKWTYTINMKNPTLNRGMQIGLAKLINEKYSSDLWVELGLVNSSDSSTWVLPPEKRKIYASKIDESIQSPYAIEQKTMRPYVSQKIKPSSGFGSNLIAKVETGSNYEIPFDIYTSEDTKKLLWVTERSIKTFGWDSLLSWKDWFSNEMSEGIVVFENIKLEKEYRLFDLHETKGIERIEIADKFDQHYVVYIISNTEVKSKEKTTLIDWAGEQPKIPSKRKIVKEDEYGRVPYRAISKVSKPVGMIPKRLEESIHSALLGLEKKYGNIDKLVSKLMGVKRKDLGNYVSAEQVDAIALFYNAFTKSQDALLADETGFGKGRILASLVKIGLRLGKTVIFMTEKSQLFTDFYRDLIDVYGDDDLNIIPTILHGKAKIFNQRGEMIAKMNHKTKPYNEMLESTSFKKSEVPLIFTTYSQINKENKDKSNVKVEWLKKRMKNSPNGCWVILDEGHNAAGDSNIKNNLKSLLKHSEGCLFSSATFAKREENLVIFENVINLPDWLKQLLNNAMAHDAGELREALTTSMARKGNFIRREHKPIDPPKVSWVNMTPEEEMYLAKFAKFWQSLYQTIAAREKAAGGFQGLAWAKIGGYLSRSVKEFSFLLKVDQHVDHILHSLENNIKPFLAIESTFESAFKSVLENELETFSNDDDIDEDIIYTDEEPLPKEKIPINGMILDHIPMWKERLALIAEKSLDLPDLMSKNPNPADLVLVNGLMKETLEILDGFPDWDLMPLERILRKIKEKGYNVGELSGRMYSYEITEDGKYKIISLEKPNRVELINAVNAGDVHYMTITKAGCTGVSVHAGSKFKDQRQRELIEGEIVVNPSERIQFWGRVRRKDQVCEPLFTRLALPILTEKRSQAREDKKKELLAAHVGMKQDFDQISWISTEGEEIIEEWALERKRFAQQIGISKPIEGNPVGRVDRALLRSIILPIKEQEGILNRLDRGLALMKDVAQKEKNIGVIRKSRKIRENWLLGHPTRNAENPKDLLSLPRINFVERVFEANSQTDYDEMVKIIKENNAHEVDGEFVMKLWERAWLNEKNFNNVINPPYHNQIWAWVKKILPLCKKGNAVQMNRPGENDLVRGVILGFDHPQSQGEKEGASAWALSQVAMKVWLIGENEPILIPLLRLYKDPSFIVSPEKANLNWFKEEVVPFVGVSIEGNPVLAAYWGKIWNVGKPILIDDEDTGLMWVWSLPKLWDWNAMHNLPKIALNLQQIYKCLRSNELDVELIAVTRPNQYFSVFNNKYNVKFNVDHDTFKESISGWGNPRNRKLFKSIDYRAKDKHNRPCVSFTLDFVNIMRIFASIDKNGIIWQIKGCSDEWYRQSSTEIMDKVINEGEKILNPNKKISEHQKKRK